MLHLVSRVFVRGVDERDDYIRCGHFSGDGSAVNVRVVIGQGIGLRNVCQRISGLRNSVLGDGGAKRCGRRSLLRVKRRARIIVLHGQVIAVKCPLRGQLHVVRGHGEACGSAIFVSCRILGDIALPAGKGMACFCRLRRLNIYGDPRFIQIGIGNRGRAALRVIGHAVLGNRRPFAHERNIRNYGASEDVLRLCVFHIPAVKGIVGKLGIRGPCDRTAVFNACDGGRGGGRAGRRRAVILKGHGVGLKLVVQLQDRTAVAGDGSGYDCVRMRGIGIKALHRQIRGCRGGAGGAREILGLGVVYGVGATQSLKVVLHLIGRVGVRLVGEHDCHVVRGHGAGDGAAGNALSGQAGRARYAAERISGCRRRVSALTDAAAVKRGYVCLGVADADLVIVRINIPVLYGQVIGILGVFHIDHGGIDYKYAAVGVYGLLKSISGNGLDFRGITCVKGSRQRLVGGEHIGIIARLDIFHGDLQVGPGAVNEFDRCALLIDRDGSRTRRQRGSVGYAVNLHIREHIARLVFIVNRPCRGGGARPHNIGCALRGVVYRGRVAVLMRDGQAAALGQMHLGDVEVFAPAYTSLILIAQCGRAVEQIEQVVGIAVKVVSDRSGVRYRHTVGQRGRCRRGANRAHSPCDGAAGGRGRAVGGKDATRYQLKRRRDGISDDAAVDGRGLVDTLRYFLKKRRKVSCGRGPVMGKAACDIFEDIRRVVARRGIKPYRIDRGFGGAILCEVALGNASDAMVIYKEAAGKIASLIRGVAAACAPSYLIPRSGGSAIVAVISILINICPAAPRGA